ncbi:MAG: PilX N-terminal domain-containing pilus assembly protein [Desulfomonilia bacterium]
MRKNIWNDQEGMVLVLVLVVLVAAIITGVTIMRTSSLETRMAGNERTYTVNFNSLESATTYALIAHTSALSSIATSIGASYTFPAGSLPGMIQQTQLSMELARIAKPPKGKGYDPSQKARFYRVQALENTSTQNLTVGAWKAFPPAN